METIYLQIQKQGRSGKSVTFLKGFTRDEFYLKELSKKFKQALGTGGTLKNQGIEIQGDFRPQLRKMLVQQGFQVKG
ncbi:MAG TPA: translation initiation factor [bacterium]|nr:translation initiation factor [bacterium]